MATALKIGTAIRNAMCDAAADQHDLNSPPAVIEIRTGAPPATPATGDSGTLLATLTMSNPAYGSASSGTCQENAISSDTSADNSGDAGHWRVKQGSGAVLSQGTAGEAADSPDLTFDDKSIVAGGTVAITNFSITMPEGP